MSVSRRGYVPVSARVDFRHSRWQTVDVYQPGLQWPLYGATTARTQAPAEIRLHPPFRLVWSRGLGRLIEFPAVVDQGVAYIGNARLDRPRDLDALRPLRLGPQHAGRARGWRRRRPSTGTRSSTTR